MKLTPAGILAEIIEYEVDHGRKVKTIYVHPATLDEIAKGAHFRTSVPTGMHARSYIYGIPVEIDEQMPVGELLFIGEEV